MRAKSLVQIQKDMSQLYEDLRRREIDLKTASELANITGKNLKAIALKHAREEFLADRPLSHKGGQNGE